MYEMYEMKRKLTAEIWYFLGQARKWGTSAGRFKNNAGHYGLTKCWFKQNSLKRTKFYR